MTEHTPTPWRVFDMNGTIAIMAGKLERHNEVIHWSGFDASHFPDDVAANAAFIVKAVNNHDKLVQALQDVLECTGSKTTPEIVRAIHLLTDLIGASK